MTLFRATEVSVSAGGQRILDRANIEIAGGELVGLIGPNGAGKTTLMRAMAGLQPIEHGAVVLDGQPIRLIERRALARRLAYVAQGSEIHWPLTVERLVALGRLPHLGAWQRPAEADRRAIAQAMEDADVDYLAERRVTTLSGGERMRALLARALAVEPEVLLADEPVAALDPLHQLELMDLLRRQADGGGATVVVLHDLSLAARFCHRLVLLHEGSVLAHGKPVDVLTPETLTHAYGIEAVIERRGDDLFVVPWRVVGREGDGRPRRGEPAP